MIKVTRLNGSHFYVNADMVQTVEGTPDTVVTLTNGVIIVVKEPPDQVVAEIIEYRRKVREARPVVGV